MKGLLRQARILLSLLWLYGVYRAFRFIAKDAHTIRLHSIQTYGPTIHEFDPYFNLRATEYLYEHGWKKFATWFDYMSWYPLGRPVGTTIYPGLQVTAVALKNYILKDAMSLYDICVYIPVWFGVLASFCAGLLAYECALPVLHSKEAPFRSILDDIAIVKWVYQTALVPAMNFSILFLEKVFGTDFGLRQLNPSAAKYYDFSSPAVECGLFASYIMAIVPAHMMRSPGGAFDNEAIAMAAMTSTFYFWTRSLRGGIDASGLYAGIWGVITGLAYFYMVAAWGGYVFVVNMIGMHAAFLILHGRYSKKLHRAYSAFFIVGTTLAIQVPVVNWTPLRSLEQMGPLAVFLGMQLIELTEIIRERRKLSRKQAWVLRFQVFSSAAAALLVGAFILVKMGYFGPISARVRGLFVKHAKTGNPLVDSVAEHQPATSDAYDKYLPQLVPFLPVGVYLIAFRYLTDSSSFLLVYAAAAYFFSLKMVRLIILTAPIASVLAGLVLGRLLGFFVYNLIDYSPSIIHSIMAFAQKETSSTAFSEDEDLGQEKKPKGGDKKKSKTKGNDTTESSSFPGSFSYKNKYARYAVGKVLVFALLQFCVKKLKPVSKKFRSESYEISVHLSHPSILFKGTLRDGGEVTVDDYREAYWWLRDNTPEDARIMAWWDYGYQIAGMANRTTLADGNTWNHEHIALLGRMLTGPERDSHRIARHLADYILLWTGGGGDDLAKSPHLARIANSVYRSVCPDDPLCSKFTTSQFGPSKMMADSLLYRLHSNGMAPGVVADPNRFHEVYRSKYGKVRIYKILGVSEESKRWIADPANRVCDAPGSWYCAGQYPPALKSILAEKRDFSQLEDFNKKNKIEDDTEYQRKYFEDMNKKDGSPTPAPTPEANSNQNSQSEKAQPWKPSREADPETVARLTNEWVDTEMTTAIWEIVSQGKVKELTAMLTEYPEAAFVRSSDGRGPMWWAYENENKRIIRVLKLVGVSDELKDAKGFSPRDMMKKQDKEL